MDTFLYVFFGTMVGVALASVWLRWVQRPKVSEEPVRVPVAGEAWLFHGPAGDPFPPKIPRQVRILEVKDGWVRYAIGRDAFNDERMKLSSFVFCYDPPDERHCA